jgi:hypothetical protein
LIVRRASVTLTCAKAGRTSISSRTFAEEDLKSWRVVKLSESDKDRGFVEIDFLIEAVDESHSLCQLSTYQIGSD